MLKKILLGLGVLAVVIGVIIGVGLGRFFGEVDFEPGHPKTSGQQIEEALIYKVLQIDAERINQQLPTMKNEFTRHEKVTLGPGLQGVLHFTVIGYSPSDGELADVRANTIKTACSDKTIKESLQHDMKWIYSYSGEDADEILRFEVNRDICGYPKELPMYAD